ncbi:hypothetical protein [Methanohalophilus portucalensis]|uniref:Uncharacterized protein n=2 Tax=Methanohalophilus portucalensis TaxID=39664 RepID=A0A1L9C2L4_9EURY|nr:hypothetical protein [Methanohalophilus portucalensis]ATU08032.1 hypothetical protein BKM01_04120 [Methanohalophilus portucalensis]OJH48772.1 hypothetical protein MPF_1819 [Methanohalophilus portucalensis FDF-1]RNI12247.1 hypothetical protein EFE41_03830 [Methanohalophilus portucalensis FDF-1]SMH43082.1 hypothetical protein SAMN06264941_1909 [Methanohalophilus portucalensis FDF-1]
MGLADRDYTKRDSNGNLTTSKNHTYQKYSYHKSASKSSTISSKEQFSKSSGKDYPISNTTLEQKKSELAAVLSNPDIPKDEKIRLKQKLKADIKYIKISLGHETNIDVINTSTNEYNYSSDKTTFCKKPKSESKPKPLSEKITSKLGNIFKSIKGKS